MFLVIHSLLF